MEWTVTFVFLLGVTLVSTTHTAQVPGKKSDHPVKSDPEAAKITTTDDDGHTCVIYPCVIFEDEFDTLDYTKWQHEITAGGGGNWEFQYYTNNRSNSYVKGGNLYIRPTLTSDKFDEGFLSSGVLDIWGHYPANQCTGNAWYGCSRQGTPDNYINPIQSARMRTTMSFNFIYGKVEIEAKMPKGDWIWPALWLMPVYEEYGTWPASGEIDIVESRGNADLQDEGGEQMGNSHAGSAMHWGPFLPYNGYDKTIGSKDSNFADAFHRFTVEWNETAISFMVDDEVIMYTDPGPGGFWELGEFDQQLPDESNPWVTGGKMAPFDKRFYVMMNVAVGGTNDYFPDTWTNNPNPKPWSNTSPFAPREFWLGKDAWLPTWNGEDAAMQVNYVRVTKMKENP